jgi:hypothetical protein
VIDILVLVVFVLSAELAAKRFADRALKEAERLADALTGK